MRFKATIMACAVLLCSAVAAQAGTITNGFTFTVASAGGGGVTGTHYHSSTGGDFGNPAGKAEVGTYVTENVRGLSEYDLTGLSAAAPAFVTFEVYKAGGLFTGTNDTPFVGTISIDAYHGNNLEDISDFQIASAGAVGSFGTAGLAVGNTLSFDITSIFNSAIGSGWSSLGIRLLTTDASGSHAWTFDTFRLTTDNQTTPSVPLPLAVWPGLALLGGVAALRRRRAVLPS